MHTNLSSYQTRILLAVFRKTYGFMKKEDWISNSQLVELTGLRKQHVSRTLGELINRNIVTKRGYKIGFNKDYQQWRELPKGGTSHHRVPRGATPSPTGVTNGNQWGETQKKEKQYTKERGGDSVNETQSFFRRMDEAQARANSLDVAQFRPKCAQGND